MRIYIAWKLRTRTCSTFFFIIYYSFRYLLCCSLFSTFMSSMPAWARSCLAWSVLLCEMMEFVGDSLFGTGCGVLYISSLNFSTLSLKASVVVHPVSFIRNNKRIDVIFHFYIPIDVSTKRITLTNSKFIFINFECTFSKKNSCWKRK